MTADNSPSGLHVFNVLRGEASEVRSVPFGDVGMVFSGQGIEMVWVSKLAEPIDASWFSSLAVDLILVVQGHSSPRTLLARPGRPRATCLKRERGMLGRDRTPALTGTIGPHLG